MGSQSDSHRAWTFLTNHAMVLVCVARDPAIRVRDIAATVGITERAAQRILSELEAAGYLRRSRRGRRNVYDVHPELPFRHPEMRNLQVGKLLDLLQDRRRDTEARAT